MLYDLTTCYSIESAWCLQSALDTEIRPTAFKLCFQFQLAPLQLGNVPCNQPVVTVTNSTIECSPSGRVVQVVTFKPVLKAPRTKRLKLKYDKLLSSFAFNFNLRLYNMVAWGRTSTLSSL